MMTRATVDIADAASAPRAAASTTRTAWAMADRPAAPYRLDKSYPHGNPADGADGTSANPSTALSFPQAVRGGALGSSATMDVSTYAATRHHGSGAATAAPRGRVSRSGRVRLRCAVHTDSSPTPPSA